MHKMHAVCAVPWVMRKMLTVTIQIRDENQNWITKSFLISKLLPGSRRTDIIGMRGKRDLESINSISDSQYLLKFRSSDLSGLQDYWTIMGTNG